MKEIEPRFGVTLWSDKEDPFTWQEIAGNFEALASLAVRQDYGLSADRPAPSIRGRLYVALDTGAVDLDSGSEWMPVRTPAASGPPTSGSWVRGASIRNSLPADGRPFGWVCVTAGSPGTWLPYGGIGSASSGGGGGSTTTSNGTMSSTMGATA